MSKAAAAKVEPLADPVAVEATAEPAKPLDERVALVLAPDADPMTSAALAELLAEIATEIERNDQLGREMRAASIDPTRVDGIAMRGAAEESEFLAARLRAGQARLQEMHSATLAREQLASWHHSVDLLEKEVAVFHVELAAMTKKAAEKRMEYDLACRAIDDIVPKVYAFMRRCDEADANAPVGETRWIARPADGLPISEFMSKKDVPKSEPVVDYSIATRVWRAAGPPMSHEEIVAADEQRRASDEAWLAKIHQDRETARVRIEGEIIARQQAAATERRQWENGM